MHVLEIPEFYAKDITSLQAAAPSLVFVYATWCGHCKTAKPIIDKVATALGWNVPVYGIDADKNALLLESMQVKSFPTIVYVSRDGVKTFQGERSFDRIIGFVCENSANNKFSACPAHI